MPEPLCPYCERRQGECICEGVTPSPPAQEPARAIDPLRTRPDYNLRCDRCKAPHNLDTSIPSRVWDVIAPEGGVLCTLCIDELMVEKGLTCEAEFYFVGQALRGKGYAESTGETEYLRRQLIAERTEKGKAEPPPAADPRADDGDCNIGDPRTGFTLADLATADESGATRVERADAEKPGESPRVEPNPQSADVGAAAGRDGETAGVTPGHPLSVRAEAIVAGCEHAELISSTGIKIRLHACRDCIAKGLHAADERATRADERLHAQAAASRLVNAEHFREVERLQGELAGLRTVILGKRRMGGADEWILLTRLEWAALAPGERSPTKARE